MPIMKAAPRLRAISPKPDNGVAIDILEAVAERW
jgi:hypothetical protein